MSRWSKPFYRGVHFHKINNELLCYGMYIVANGSLLIKGEGLWKVTRICSAGITITAVMARIHYALRLIRRPAVRAGLCQRHYVGGRCMANTQKGSNHVRAVPFTSIFIIAFQPTLWTHQSSMIQGGWRYSVTIYLFAKKAPYLCVCKYL